MADGFHLVNCKGRVVVERCAHTGLGDDFLNIHGCNSVVRKVAGARTVLAARTWYVDAGDEVWLLRKGEDLRREVLRVASVKAAKLDDKTWGDTDHWFESGANRDVLIRDTSSRTA